jgi:hypothetical protein
MRLVLAFLVCSLSVPMLASAQSSASKTPAGLAQPHAMTVGDLAALSMTQYAAVIRATSGGYDAPVIATFHRESQQIVIRVFGVRDEVDEAKSSLNRFRAEVLPLLAGYVAATHGVQVSDSQITLAYLDRNRTREIIRYENGKYVVSQ